MANLFSLPAFPNATSYNLTYSDPLPTDPNKLNKFGPWLPLPTVLQPSNIFDPLGTPLRLYQAAPTVYASGNAYTLPFFESFSVAQPAPNFFSYNLYDAQITNLLGAFRDFIGDYGDYETSSTSINADTGSGIGLIQPDGIVTVYNLGSIPDAQPPILLEYSVHIVKNGLTLLLNSDYIVEYDKGSVTFAVPPYPTDTINISYREVKYTNRMLDSALQVSIDTLSQFNINGYGIMPDNNVLTVVGVIGNNGLRPIIFTIAQKILNRATIRVKSEQARAYKSDNFSIDTAPGRLIDGMSTQSVADFAEIKSMATAYIKTATVPMVRDAYDSFFDASGILPELNWLVAGYYGAGWSPSGMSGSFGWM